MIVIFRDKGITAGEVSDALNKNNMLFSISGLERSTGKLVRGLFLIKKIDKHGRMTDGDDEDTEYVREKLEDDLGTEITEIDDDDDVRFVRFRARRLK